MVPEKFKQFFEEVRKQDEDDAVFGFYYKNENGKETLGVNGGDWMGNEISDVINEWGKTNDVTVVYEAEVDEEHFKEQGYEEV